MPFLGQSPAAVITGNGILDGTITAADLHTTLDLSTKTITYPSNSVTAAALHTTAVTDKLGYTPLQSSDLAGYATESYVNTAVATVDLTGYATESYVTTAVSNLVDSAPGALDTLNELAAALNDDANFSTTITNSLALKAPLASPSFTGNVGIGTSSPQSKLDIAVGSAGAPTYKGYIRVFSNSATADGGIELFPSAYGNGFGTRLITIDSGNGETPFVIQNRQNSATWTERMRITSAGNVGIGTASPASAAGFNLLTLNGSTSGGLYIQNNGTNRFRAIADTAATYLYAMASTTLIFGSGDTERMRIDSSGNVGIGLTGPSEMLEVNGNAHFRGTSANSAALQLGQFSDLAYNPLVQMFCDDVSGDIFDIRLGRYVSDFRWSRSSSNGSTLIARLYSGNGTPRATQFYLYNQDDGASTSTAAVALNTSGNSYLNGGNVGIGTSSPATKLHVAGDAIIKQGAGNTAIFSIAGNNNSTNSSAFDFIQGGDNHSYIVNRSNADIRIYTNNTEHMRITSSGLVGIGTSGPAYKLDVSCGTLGTTIGDSTDMLRIRQTTSSNDQLLVWSYRHTSTTSNWTTVSTRIQKKVDNTLQGYMEFNPAGNLTGIAWGTGYDANQGTAKEQMRLRSDGLLQFNSGYGSVATAYGCRAWVNFMGVGTVSIRQSGNVSSITDYGTGNFGVNFSTAMPDTNYAVTGSASRNDNGDGNTGVISPRRVTTAYQTSSIRIATQFNSDTSGANVDFDFNHVVIHR